MKRFLGVDFGMRRIGLAVASVGGFGGQPLRTLERSRRLGHDIELIVAHAVREQVDAIVVGLPLHADGTLSMSAQRATEFANALRKSSPVPVLMHDEYRSTADAESELIAMDVSRQRRRQVIDQMAAVQILESFLRWRGEQGPEAVPPDPSA